MNSHPIFWLMPVFHFFDHLIEDYGDILFLVFVYAAIPFLAWVLSGGLRCKLYRGKSPPQLGCTFGIYIPIGRPPTQSPALPPLVVEIGSGSFPGDDEDSCVT